MPSVIARFVFLKIVVLITAYTTLNVASIALFMPPRRPMMIAATPARDDADMYVYVQDDTLQAAKYFS